MLGSFGVATSTRQTRLTWIISRFDGVTILFFYHKPTYLSLQDHFSTTHRHCNLTLDSCRINHTRYFSRPNMLQSIMYPHTIHKNDESDTLYSTSPSSTTSSTSSSLSPPGLTYANPICIPLKSLISPPSTTTTTADYFSLSPATPSSVPFNSPNTNAMCAYPSWPSGPTLSSTTTSSTCSSGGCAKSSYISDDDLLDLEKLELCGDVRIVHDYPEISWSQTRQPPVVVKARDAHTGSKSKRKRRNSPLKKGKFTSGMSPIVEAEE